MEQIIPLEVESAEHAGGFFVPQFVIKIGGAELEERVIRDIIEVTYKDNIDDMDSFQMTLNNWDEETWDFKYIGGRAETAQVLEQGGEAASRFKLFEPCDRNKQVDLLMGYVGRMRTMIRGSITTMEPNFPSGGPPSLSVRGINVLHRLRKSPYSDAWEGKRDSEIAMEISQRRDPKRGNAKRFPYPIKIDEEAKSEEPQIPFIGMKNEHDIDFLWKRARARGYVLLVEEEQNNQEGGDASSQTQLYFGPSRQGRSQESYELEWGKSLIDFKPTLTTANQFKSVTVNGWDRRRQKPISVTVALDKLAENRRKAERTCKNLRNLNVDLQEMLNGCEPREEYVVDEPIFDENQAKQRACALLFDQFKQMVKASGTTVGLPYLVAGSKVLIKGVGARLSGTYFVTETTHTINDSGYITKFKARREDENQGAAP